MAAPCFCSYKLFVASAIQPLQAQTWGLKGTRTPHSSPRTEENTSALVLLGDVSYSKTTSAADPRPSTLSMVLGSRRSRSVDNLSFLATIHDIIGLDLLSSIPQNIVLALFGLIPRAHCVRTRSCRLWGLKLTRTPHFSPPLRNCSKQKSTFLNSSISDRLQPLANIMSLKFR